MGRKVVLGFIIFALFAAMVADGQPKCKIIHYSTEDGLSHDNLSCMLKDKEGFMWFGTWDGINRFDGKVFKKYKSKSGDSSVLRNNRIYQIVEYKAGFLQLRAYDYQVYRFDKKRESFYAVTPSLSSGADKFIFTGIRTASNGTVWLITEKNGLFYSKSPDSTKPGFVQMAARLGNINHLPSNTINFWHEDSGQNIWIGTDKGLVEISKQSQGHYIARTILANGLGNLCFTMLKESVDYIQFGTADGKLISYYKSTKSFSWKQIATSAIIGICVSNKKNVVFTTTAAGELISSHIADYVQSSVKIRGVGGLFSIFEDSKGGLWLEPIFHGIIHFNPGTRVYKTYTQPNEPNYIVGKASYKVFEDNRGMVWANMKGGGFGYYDREKLADPLDSDVVEVYKEECNHIRLKTKH